MDLILVVDESTRMDMHERSVISFLTSLVSEMSISDTQTHVSLGLFRTMGHEQFDLDAHMSIESLTAAISHIRFHGGYGDIEAGISYAVNDAMTHAAGDRPGVPNVVVIITADGDRNFGGHLFALEHEIHLKSDNVILIELGHVSIDHLATDNGHELRLQWIDEDTVDDVLDLICPY